MPGSFFIIETPRPCSVAVFVRVLPSISFIKFTPLILEHCLTALSLSKRQRLVRWLASPYITLHAPDIYDRACYFMCPDMSLVISNILTWLLPLKTGRSESSALIIVLFFLS